MTSRERPLLQVQIECLERNGDCDGCFNQLESQQCQVKWTEGVAEKLGLPMLHKRRKIEVRKKDVRD